MSEKDQEVEPYYLRQANELVTVLHDQGIVDPEISLEARVLVEDYVGYIMQVHCRSAVRSSELSRILRERLKPAPPIPTTDFLTPAAKPYAATKLERGTALVITGPEGSGKSTLARAIAKAHGRFVVATDGELLGSPFGLGRVLESQPDTLVIEMGEADTWPIDYKLLITEQEIPVNRQYKAQITVRTPHVILVRQELVTLPFSATGAGVGIKVIDL